MKRIISKIRILRHIAIIGNLRLNKAADRDCLALRRTIINLDKSASISIKDGTFILNAKNTIRLSYN
jgi:hypothetical protein